jgi:phosphate transport system protein
VNAMEVEIDRDLSSIIARRQPTARDLRLLIAISKTTANLERVGDEAEKIARMVRSIIKADRPVRCRHWSCAWRRIWHRAIAEQGAGCLCPTGHDGGGCHSERGRSDRCKEFDGFVRKLITYMMEDPRMISPSLDLLFLAKAIERIGDHAKNIAEFIIYVVKGEDVRHTTMEQIESVIK